MDNKIITLLNKELDYMVEASLRSVKDINEFSKTILTLNYIKPEVEVTLPMNFNNPQLTPNINRYFVVIGKNKVYLG